MIPLKHCPDMVPNCNKCEYFYITWDKRFPYGCRVMGFKSRELPMITVRANSGLECLKFKLKKQKSKRSRISSRARFL